MLNLFQQFLFFSYHHHHGAHITTV